MIGREKRVLLRHYLEQGMPKAAIARHLGVSRRTVYNWIEAGELDRGADSEAVRYRPRAPASSKLDAYKGIIDTRLADYPRLSAVRLFNEVQTAGYPGGYGQVKRYVREVRPRVSDDNPFSEAHFKTVKYHPSFPGRFPDISAAINFCRSFFPWYNNEHRHGGIAMLTPADVHHDRAPEMLAQRESTLQQAWSEHPERFVKGIPKPQPLPTEVWINPPAAASTPQPTQ